MKYPDPLESLRRERGLGESSSGAARARVAGLVMGAPPLQQPSYGPPVWALTGISSICHFLWLASDDVIIYVCQDSALGG